MKCPDCGNPLPRRTDRIWMVTWTEGEPPYWYEDVPMYFTSQRAAKEYRSHLEADPEYSEPPLVVKIADDAKYDDIAWHPDCYA